MREKIPNPNININMKMTGELQDMIRARKNTECFLIINNSNTCDERRIRQEFLNTPEILMKMEYDHRFSLDDGKTALYKSIEDLIKTEENLYKNKKCVQNNQRKDINTLAGEFFQIVKDEETINKTLVTIRPVCQHTGADKYLYTYIKVAICTYVVDNYPKF